MIRLEEVFNIAYGNSFELNKLTRTDLGINFVSRTEKNNGVSAQVERVEGVEPCSAGEITVSLGGSVLEAFVQPCEFYTGYHIYRLTPRGPMTLQEKLFYCHCIRKNKYRYNYGRQANRTLKDILLPSKSEIPGWVYECEQEDLVRPESSWSKAALPVLNIESWRPFKYKDLFDIERGRGPRKKELDGEGEVPFISASEYNNGLTGWTKEKAVHLGSVITVVRNGNSVANAFYQIEPFCSTEDVHVFRPKFRINKAIALFMCTLIKREAYRFSYGRKWGIERMKESIILLPALASGEPDLAFMEDFIKSLPYSSQIF